MLVQTSESKVNMLAEDDFGIVYLIENAQQFWSGALYHMSPWDMEEGSNLQSRAVNLCFLDLDDVLRVPSDGSATLSMLDTALRRFVSLCASYHGQLRHDCISRSSCVKMLYVCFQNSSFKVPCSWNMHAIFCLTPSCSYFTLNGCASWSSRMSSLCATPSHITRPVLKLSYRKQILTHNSFYTAYYCSTVAVNRTSFAPISIGNP